jgi:hypothetical protein
MLHDGSQLMVELQAAYLGVFGLVESAPLNDEQVKKLEEYVKTFWRLAVQISETPNCSQLQA